MGEHDKYPLNIYAKWQANRECPILHEYDITWDDDVQPAMDSDKGVMTYAIKRIISFDANYLMYLHYWFVYNDNDSKVVKELQHQISKSFAYISYEIYNHFDINVTWRDIGVPFSKWTEFHQEVPVKIIKSFLEFVFANQAWTVDAFNQKSKLIQDIDLQYFVSEYYPVIEYILINSEENMQKIMSGNEPSNEYIGQTFQLLRDKYLATIIPKH